MHTCRTAGLPSESHSQFLLLTPPAPTPSTSFARLLRYSSYGTSSRQQSPTADFSLLFRWPLAQLDSAPLMQDNLRTPQQNRWALGNLPSRCSGDDRVSLLHPRSWPRQNLTCVPDLHQTEAPQSQSPVRHFFHFFTVCAGRDQSLLLSQSVLYRLFRPGGFTCCDSACSTAAPQLTQRLCVGAVPRQRGGSKGFLYPATYKEDFSGNNTIAFDAARPMALSADELDESAPRTVEVPSVWYLLLEQCWSHKGHHSTANHYPVPLT